MTAFLYFGGPIHTMDADNSQPEAVLTIGERIAAVGSLAELSGQMPEGTRKVDLDGRTLLPAFIDPHGHFPDSGINHLFRVDVSSPHLGDCVSLGKALDRLRAKAKSVPSGDWVIGVLYDNTAIAERRMPTKSELDDVSTSHPVWVAHASGHNGVANSLALKLQGIEEETTPPFGGRYGKDPESGELNGLIEGNSAIGEMNDGTFQIDVQQFWEGFDAARDEYLSHGVTLAQNAWVSRELLSYFAKLPAGHDPGIDVVLLPAGEEEPGMTRGEEAERLSGSRHITIGPRKLFTDGAFQLQTAWMTAPYLDPLDPKFPCGTAYIEPDLYRKEVMRLHSLGFQVHCHCNGDRAADLFIDAVSDALDQNPRGDHRHTIIHGQTLREDQLDRLADLGITVSFFSAHVHYWGDLHYHQLLGPERANRISPAASAEERGVRFTLHNDASVTPTRPLHLAHCAVNRRTASGRLLGSDQRISRLSAIRAQTIDAAWQVFQEGERGSIEPEKLADLVILTENPLDSAIDLEKIRVSATIRRGVAVFRRSLPLSKARSSPELTGRQKV